MTDRLRRRHSGDLFRGAVECRDPMRAVERDQPGVDGLEDQVLESLEVPEVLLLGLELLAGGAVPFAEINGSFS